MTEFRPATAIITGGASGIGRALAAALVARGTYAVLADLDGEAAERAARESPPPAPDRRSPHNSMWPTAPPSSPWSSRWPANGEGSR